MPNTPTVTRSGRNIRLNGYTLTPAEARRMADQLNDAASAPPFAPIPGTLTVTAPVSSKAGNNVLHGVKTIKISGGRVYCYMGDGSQPKYEDGSQHRSFSLQVRATKGPRRGLLCSMDAKSA